MVFVKYWKNFRREISKSAPSMIRGQKNSFSSLWLHGLWCCFNIKNNNEEKNMGIDCQFPVLIIYVEQVNKNMLIY